jgi:aspartate/methionine/tyrosine aminotransferase
VPPHCDAMDGPVVKAAARALEALDSTLVLPYVPSEGEEELRQSFAKAVQLREQSDAARELPTVTSSRPWSAYTGLARESPSPA